MGCKGKIFKVGRDSDHEIGNKDCVSRGHHETKECVCGGLIHMSISEEIFDDDYPYSYLCDKCGDNWREV